MKILATTELVGEFWFEYIALCIISLLCFSMATICINILFQKFAIEGVYITIIVLAVAVMFAFFAHKDYKEGIEKEYKVLITDYNEVYGKGYEIIKQEGEIFTIKKKEK